MARRVAARLACRRGELILCATMKRIELGGFFELQPCFVALAERRQREPILKMQRRFVGIELDGSAKMLGRVVVAQLPYCGESR